MEFEVNSKIINDRLILTFGSKVKLELLLKNIKFFYENNSIKEENFVVPIFLDTGKFDEVSLKFDSNLKIRAVTFIAKDNMNKKQYSISICVNTNMVTSKEMLYNS